MATGHEMREEAAAHDEAPVSEASPEAGPACGTQLGRRTAAVLAGAGIVATGAVIAACAVAVSRALPMPAGIGDAGTTDRVEVLDGSAPESETSGKPEPPTFMPAEGEATRGLTDDLGGANMHEKLPEDTAGAKTPVDGERQQVEEAPADGDSPAVPPSREGERSLPATLGDVVSVEMMRDNFVHGPMPSDKVRYIVMHDTEAGTDSATAVAQSWGDGPIAAHFVVGKDGTVVQCVPIDAIAHHAGNADYGQNDAYGIWAERDDEVGRTGSGDYAMNAWSIGIEIVHEHDEGAYAEEQLAALDRLVAAIDAAVGHQPSIIDHKAWAGERKQDVSDDFPMEAYQRRRRHGA